MSAGKEEIGAGWCWNTLRSAHNPASASLVPIGTDLRSSTRDVAVPCSTSDATLSDVPFAREPGCRNSRI